MGPMPIVSEVLEVAAAGVETGAGPSASAVSNEELRMFTSFAEKLKVDQLSL